MVTLLAVVLNENPLGALRIIVPRPIFPVADSLRTGPVNAVYAPPVVSAEIEEPPVAAVTVAAKTSIGSKNKTNAKINNEKGIYLY